MQQNVYQLPVVVHVIHMGEAVGRGTNIPESQILNQLETLNTDFRALNEAQIQALPPEFQELAADTEIEFVLARQTPEGLPTSGITRTQAPEGKTSYSLSDDIDLKRLIHWPPENYINLYSVDLAGDFIGYAQFPESDRLQGLDLGKVSEETDGVVIDYQYFGTGGNAAPASLGRTLTHEMGHYLGLRHTWGDGGCSEDDYVEDTPFSSESYVGQSNCNSSPSSCGSPDMFQNYMYYTNDECMSLFTIGQSDRMAVVLEYSPRREKLNDSFAKEEPTIVENDAGLAQFSLLITEACTKSFIPSLQLGNFGSNQVNSVQIGIFINNLLLSTQTFSGLGLDYLETTSIQLEEVVPEGMGELQIEARILQTNNTTDNKSFNNRRDTDLFVPFFSAPPLLQSFHTSLSPFYRINPDFYLTWQLEQAPITGDPDNLAAFMNFYDYEINFGAKDLLISPILDLSGMEQAFLNFRLAYTTYSASDQDGLEIYITTDCSENLENAVLLYAEYGQDLATAPSTTNRFIPSGNEDWRTEQIDLSAYVDLENLQLIFVGVNDFGNNLYLDDINIFVEPPDQLDVALTSIRIPSVASCEFTPSPTFILRNEGLETIENVSIDFLIDNNHLGSQTFDKLGLATQESIQLQAFLDFEPLQPGKHIISARVVSPNNRFDDNPTNDFRGKQFAVDSSADVIPFRQRFQTNDPLNGKWTNINPNPQEESWDFQPVNGGRGDNSNIAAVSAFFEQTAGQENWLVSPVLDFTDLSLAGVQFRHSYANHSTAFDLLQVRVSTDCGITWSEILYEKRGPELSERTSHTRWYPKQKSDWDTSFVDLSAYVGLPNVRVAFVAISGGGNDIYLDDIEFFESNMPFTVRIPDQNSMYVAPNPTSDFAQLVFNLQEREDVQLKVYNSRGSLVLSHTLPNTLNQIYSLDMRLWPAGLYIVHVQSPSLQKFSRVVLAK